MALSDLTIFQEYTRSSATEVLAQQVDLFNEASAGTLTMGVKAVVGDYVDNIFFKIIPGLVKRRNPYGTSAQTALPFTNISNTMVKVAAGSVPVDFQPTQFAWIQQHPEDAGVALGQQLAKYMMADMLNVAVMSATSAIANVGATVVSAMGGTYAAPLALNFKQLALGAGLFGDAQSLIRGWVLHSTPVTSLYINSLTNAEKLFLWDTINVTRDQWGRILIVTDCPALQLQVTNGTTTPNIYGTLGLVPGGISIEQQDDFTDNYDQRNLGENISRTYQSEWSYMVGLLGYTWNKVAGGHAPTNAALATGTNWIKTATNIKDTAGIMITSNS